MQVRLDFIFIHVYLAVDFDVTDDFENAIHSWNLCTSNVFPSFFNGNSFSYHLNVIHDYLNQKNEIKPNTTELNRTDFMFHVVFSTKIHNCAHTEDLFVIFCPVYYQLYDNRKLFVICCRHFSSAFLESRALVAI